MGCHLSDREGNADSAERISDNLLTVIWAENHVNEPFKCRVYGFDKNHLRIKYGLVEFRLPYNELPDSNLGFKTNETRTCMKSLQNGKTYKIGDEIIVKILFTDRSSRSIITTTDLNKVYSKTKPEILKAPLESSPIKADAKKKYYKLMDATCKQKSKSKRKNKHKSNKQRKDDEYSF